MNEDEWTCYPCRLGEVEDLATMWREKGHRVIIEPVENNRRRVWIKDEPDSNEAAVGLTSETQSRIGIRGVNMSGGAHHGS